MKITVEKRHFERAFDIRKMWGDPMQDEYREFMGLEEGESTTFSYACFCPIALALKEQFGIEENVLHNISVGCASYHIEYKGVKSLSQEARKLVHAVDILMVKAEQGNVSREEFMAILAPTVLELDLRKSNA